jgi:hypothetical protein
MTQCLATAVKPLLPFLAAELVVLSIQWFVVPEGSWLTYPLAAISFFVLPSFAAVRLTRASFRTGPAVLSALTFTALGLGWAACAAALGYAGTEWRAYLLGVLVSFLLIGAPLQLLAAYVGTIYARYTVNAAT